MAKAQAPAEALPEVEVKSSGEALAEAVAQGKVDQAGEATDLTNAKEVTDVGGTVVVRW